MSEIWKDIFGYEGKYQVSDLGQVRSMNYRNTGEVRLLIPHDMGHGYFAVGLRDRRGKIMHYVHRLVANAFLDNPNGLPQVNHLDHDRGNNNVSNLEWCSIRDNLLYGDTHNKEICTQQQTHPSRKAVAQYDLFGNLLRIFNSQREAERETGIHSPDISMCCTGKNKTAGGYIFKFYPSKGAQRCETKNIVVR